MSETNARGWPPAIEDAFLAALEAGGSVKAACAAIGKWPANAYQHRKIAPDFAARWDAIVAARRVGTVLRALVPAGREGAGRLMAGYRVRRDGWTERRQKMFLLALSQTGCVRDACGRARISNTSAYRMRARCPRFALAWDRALAKAAPTLEYAAYQRALEGWDETLVRNGEVVSVRRRYSDSLLRLLLQRGDLNGARARAMDPRTLQADLVERAREAAHAAGGAFYTPAKEEETNKALMKQLAVLRKQMEREQARDAVAAMPAARADDRAWGEKQWRDWRRGWGEMARPPVPPRALITRL